MIDFCVIYTDTEDNRLSVIPKSVEGYDPVISIKNKEDEVLFITFPDKNVPDIIRKMVDGLNLDEPTLYCVIGKIQDLIDQKEQLRIG